MKRALFAPLVLLVIGLERTAQAQSDPWFGRDKALHFGVSAALAAGGYAASSPWLDSRAERALVGGGFSLTLGASKELWDLAGHGDPSWRDFTWDVVGTAVGVALALGIDAVASPKRETQSTAHGLVFHF
jgi:putative lipoprotein